MEAPAMTPIALAPVAVPAAIKIKLSKKKIIKSAVVVEPVDEIPPEEPVKTDLEIKVIEIKKKIVLTSEQVIILQKEKKELERQKEYDDWKHNEVIFKSDWCNYWKEQEEKLIELAKKNNINYHLVVCDSCDRFDSSDEFICKKIFDELYTKNKKTERGSTGKTKPQNPIGEGKRRCEIEENLRSGKMNDKIMGLTAEFKGYRWGILQKGKNSNKNNIIAKQGETYTLPVWSEILDIVGREGEWKKKEDMISWITKNMKK
jgi:hypothetical protein